MDNDLSEDKFMTQKDYFFDDYDDGIGGKKGHDRSDGNERVEIG